MPETLLSLVKLPRSFAWEVSVQEKRRQKGSELRVNAMFPYLSFQCHPALPGWAVSCPCASQMSLMCRNTSLWLGITSLVWLERCFLSPCEPELFSFCIYSISGHLLSEKSRESIPVNEWLYIQIPTADKHLHLLPCVHLMQDFCAVPSSSFCCLMGQAKLSLSSWRRWDFNDFNLCCQELFHHGTSEEPELSLENPARAFQVWTKSVGKREWAASEDPAHIPKLSNRNILALCDSLQLWHPQASPGDV